jgi:hypothetical protein
MGATGVVRANEKPEKTNKEVTCIFCGLATPVLASRSSRVASQVHHDVLIVRCEVCGKEAPYHATDTFAFGETIAARSQHRRNRG